MSQTFCVAKLLNVGKVKHRVCNIAEGFMVKLMQAFRLAIVLRKKK